MGWLFKDIILVVGLVIMALMSVVGVIGLGFDIQQIRENIAIWGLTWFEAGSIGFAIAFWVVVVKLIWRLNKFEKIDLRLRYFPVSLLWGGN